MPKHHVHPDTQATPAQARELVRAARMPTVAFFMPKNATRHHFIDGDCSFYSDHVRRAFCTLTCGRIANSGFTIIMN